MDSWLAVRLVIVNFNLPPLAFRSKAKGVKFWTQIHHQSILLKRANFGLKQIFMILASGLI